jgi:hypothetical protein
MIKTNFRSSSPKPALSVGFLSHLSCRQLHPPRLKLCQYPFLSLFSLLTSHFCIQHFIKSVFKTTATLAKPPLFLIWVTSIILHCTSGFYPSSSQFITYTSTRENLSKPKSENVTSVLKTLQCSPFIQNKSQSLSVV